MLVRVGVLVRVDYEFRYLGFSVERVCGIINMNPILKYTREGGEKGACGYITQRKSKRDEGGADARDL